MERVGRRDFLKASAFRAWLFTCVVSGLYNASKWTEYYLPLQLPPSETPELVVPKPDSFLLAAAPDQSVYPPPTPEGINPFSDFPIIHLFFNENGLYRERTMRAITNVVTDGKMPMISLDPAQAKDGVFRFGRDTDNYLASIRPFLAWLNSLNSPVLLRTFYEMNGNWTIYGSQVNKPQDFVEGYKKFVTEIRRVVPKAKTILSVNGGIPFEEYFPPDDFIDIAGIDTYNKFRMIPFGAMFYPNPSFEEAVFPDIARIQRLTSKPIMITETNIADQSRRLEWFRRGIAISPSLKNVIGLGGFFYDKSDLGVPNEADWDMTHDKVAWDTLCKEIVNNPTVFKPKGPIRFADFNRYLKQ